jgi:hypothetical protein
MAEMNLRQLGQCCWEIRAYPYVEGVDTRCIALEEKTVLNDYATTIKTVHNDSFSVVFQSLWTVLVVVA